MGPVNTMATSAVIRMCSNCTHWTPLVQKREGAHGGSCPIKNRLTSWMSLCDEFKSKVVPLGVDQQKQGDRT